MRGVGRAGAALLAGACLALVSAFGAGGASTRPHALRLYVNGQYVQIVPIVGGSDDYAQLHAKTMLLEARWVGDAGGSGYYVRLSTDEPKTKVYATCTSGTSCKTPSPVPLGIDLETSWYIQIISTKGNKVVSGYKYCLVRYS
jgi:hypothetical protein